MPVSIEQSKHLTWGSRVVSGLSNRRSFLLKTGGAAASLTLWEPHCSPAEEVVPHSVADLWADFDPCLDPLEVEVIREWREEGGVFRLVRYLIGTFKGRAARMAAIYGYPEGAAEKLPAVMHIHGGGQRAFLHEVKFLVGRGYAALSVNWGGSGTGRPPMNAPDCAQPGDPNTDWGAVDPTQLNVPGYDSMLPGPKQYYEDREHPKNNNWYLLTLGCRRGLTFLEQQPEVDASRLGVHGYSMGGNLAMYLAGCDARVKAAVPAVGGQGWRWQAHEFNGFRARPQDSIKGNVEVFRRTMSFESYAPQIQCPLLHRSATNDFHGWMDDVYRTNALVRSHPVRYSWVPHMNHQLRPEVAVTMPLWFDHHLKGAFSLPETPGSVLHLRTDDGVPMLCVTPSANGVQSQVAGEDRPALPMPAVRCEIFYSTDPDPRARFWRSGDVVRKDDCYVAKLPLHSHDQPLFAFANVYYRLPVPVSLAAIPGNSRPVTEVCISSLLHSRHAVEIRQARPVLTAKPSTLIDGFALGLRDWYVLNAGNLTHQQLWTRKVTDPLWRGPDGARLTLTLRMPHTNRLSIVLQQNEWRNYRGSRKTFVCRREIPGLDAPQTLTLGLSDFTSLGDPPTSWAELDQLGICANFGTPASEAERWKGPAPEFFRVAWEVV